MEAKGAKADVRDAKAEAARRAHSVEQGATTDVLLAGFIGVAGQLSENAESLFKASTFNRAWKIGAAALFIADIVLSGLIGLGVWKINNLAAENKNFAKENNQLLGSLAANSAQGRAILREIQSCTTPEGACAKRGESSQAAAIASIIKQFSQVDGAYSLIVGECSHAGTPTQVVACFHAKAREAGLEK